MVFDLMITSAVRRKVVGLVLLNPLENLYARQIARIILESPHAVGLELKRLESGGLLTAAHLGRQVCYRVNAAYPYLSELTSIVKKMRSAGDVEMRALPDLAQARRIEGNLARVVEDLRRHYDPEKIILFGSAAAGLVGPYSDIDLVIIKETALSFIKRAQQVVELLEYDVDIDFMIYTPQEFAAAVRTKRFFRDEIRKKGRVIYEKAA